MTFNTLTSPLRRLRPALLSVALFAATAWAALPPEVEADRQLQKAASMMDQLDKGLCNCTWSDVSNALLAAEKTGTAVPENFDFHLGRALGKIASPTELQLNESISRLTGYLSRHKANAKYYKEALKELTSAEDALASFKTAQAKQQAAQRAKDEEQEKIRIAEKARDEKFNAAMKEYQAKLAEWETVEYEKYRQDVAECEKRTQGYFDECYAVVEKMQKKFWREYAKEESQLRSCTERYNPDRCGPVRRKEYQAKKPTPPARSNP